MPHPARDPDVSADIQRSLRTLEDLLPDCGVILVAVPEGPSGSLQDSLVATNLSPLATLALLRSLLDNWQGRPWEDEDDEPPDYDA